MYELMKGENTNQNCLKNFRTAVVKLFVLSLIPETILGKLYEVF